MTDYARPDPSDPTRNDLRDFAAPPPFAKGWRPLTIDAQPTPSASQVLVNTGIVFTATTATQTWSLRAKTQAELDADAEAAELAALKAMVQALSEDIALGVTAAPTTAAQAFVHIQEIKRQVLRLNRAVRWQLKQQR
ncbi:MAG: hypothetical protein V4750_06060 [Pseudomonadota bacterium]